jgi:hypothetical protein
MMRAVIDPWVSDFQGGNGMSLRRFLIAFVCLAWSWAGSVTSVEAQVGAKPAKTDKLMRVTYSVGDLVVPVPGSPGPDNVKARQEALIHAITNTVAKKSWECSGGVGVIHYFPFGMALIVDQRVEVHEEIGRLLAELRRLHDVQISVEMRFVHVSASIAAHLFLDVEQNGQPVRTVKEIGKESPDCAVSMDDKQVAALLKLARIDETSIITQAPKLTMLHGQQARIGSSRTATELSNLPSVGGFYCEMLPILDPQKEVRLSLNVQYYSPEETKAGQKARVHPTKAARTFFVPSGRTLVWHVGATTERQHLFVLATPRVVVVEEEERIFVGELAPIPGGAAEEQSAPAPKTADMPRSSSPRIGETKPPTGQTRLHDPKERAIEYRLRQPISLNFKNVPLEQVLNDLAVISGVAVVPDKRAMQDARINLESPLTFSVENISMKSALNLMLKELRLTHTIENQVLMITTKDKTRGQLVRVVRVTYAVDDLIGVGPDNPLPDVLNIQKGIERSMTPTSMCTQGKANKDRTPDAMAEVLKELIQNTVAKNTWESVGGRGNIQYYPFEKKLVVNQCNEVHEEIANLLAALRRMYDVSVDVETRFVHMSANTAKLWRKTLAEPSKNVDLPESAKSGALVSIDDARLFMLLEAVQGDRTATINQYPKLALLNNQAGECKEPNSTGWCAAFHPVVSADRRSVSLKVNLEHRTRDEAKSIERITKAAKTIVLPNGSTLVWDLGETAGRHQLFVLVTPRIRVRQEEERIFLGEDAPIPGR